MKVCAHLKTVLYLRLFVGNGPDLLGAMVSPLLLIIQVGLDSRFKCNIHVFEEILGGRFVTNIRYTFRIHDYALSSSAPFASSARARSLAFTTIQTSSLAIVLNPVV